MSSAPATPAPGGAAPPDPSAGRSGGPSGEALHKPLDHHPDGTPMSQEEIDAHWLAHVFRPNEPQLTPRAVITGMLLGGVMSLSNLYVGLKTGWGLAVTVTSAVLAFGIFSGLRKVAPVGPFRRDFGSLENNTMASAASAAGYFTGAGLTSAIPGLYMATGRVFTSAELAIWILAISFLGVLLAVPMRRQMIDIDRLPFPEGLAYAETIRSLHAAPGEARKKALALLYGAIAGATMKLLGGVSGVVIRGKQWALSHPILPEAFGPEKWLGLTLGLQTDILMLGAGAMMGVRICAGLLLGAVIAWGILPPWLDEHGLAATGATFSTVRTWLVWPGVTLVVVNGLLAFGLKWRTAFAALAGIGRLARGGRGGGMSEVEVPTSWFLGGLAVVVPMVTILAWALFDIPFWMGLLATVMSILLSIVACRATGETSITPIGALGKITQFMYGGLAAGNVQTNLMTASITAGAAMHSADLLTDLKGGYVLGSRPRHQFLSQFFGILAGAVFCIPAYQILATPERLGSAEFPAPAAKTWQAVAELLAGGIDRKVRGDAEATAATAGALGLALVPVGTAAGDALVIGDGANAGRYQVRAVVGKSLLLDRPVPAPEAVAGSALTVESPAGEPRGKSEAGKWQQLPAVSVAALPAGAIKGDYLLLESGGHDLWWNVRAVDGTTLVLDRPLEDPRDHAPLPSPSKLQLRKESLPPHALTAVLIAAIVGVFFTLVESYAPKKLRAYLPSITGVGLGFVISGLDSISMFLGALLAWGLQRFWPKKAEELTLASASGIMAGGSLAGILIIVLSRVLHVLVTP